MDNRLESEAQQRVVAGEDAQNLLVSTLLIRQALQNSQVKTSEAMKVNSKLRATLLGHERQLEQLISTKTQLENITSQARLAQLELETLRKQHQSSTEHFEHDALLQKRDIDEKSQEIRRLRQKLEQQNTKLGQLDVQVQEHRNLVEMNASLRKEVERLEQDASAKAQLAGELDDQKKKTDDLESALSIAARQALDMDKLDNDNAALREQKTELEKKVASIPALQQRLGIQDQKMTELKSSLSLARQRAQGMEELAQEKLKFNGQLKELQSKVATLDIIQSQLELEQNKTAELKTCLVTAQEQAGKVDQLQADIVSLRANVQSLSADLQRKVEECAQVEPLKHILEQKNEELAELHERLQTFQAQTVEINALKQDVQRKQEEQTSLQLQIVALEGALSNAQLDQQADVSRSQEGLIGGSRRSEKTSRKLVTHSSTNRPAQLLSDGDVPVSSGCTDIIPETQPEVPETLQDSLGQRFDLDGEESDSDLSSMLPSEPDSDEEERPQSEHFPYSRGQGYVSPTQTRHPTDSQPPAARPPSSSYESHSDQMLLDQISPMNSQGTDYVSSPPAAQKPNLGWDRLLSATSFSPRRLRSGSQMPPRLLQASPGSGSRSPFKRASTPAIRREQHLPNSAAKRQMEPDADDQASQGNLKKLKRRPANMEVINLQLRSSNQNVPPTPPRLTGSWRQSNTVVRTNAPAPGKTPQSANPSRKNSRRDRYASRFAAHT
jgi:hypothetical protein